jgi:hypothetical protein
MRIGLILLTFVIFGSCSHKENGTELINRKDFVNLLVDLHLADAYTTDHSITSFTGDLDSLTIYTSVLNKYHVDKDMFMSTLKWYTNHPKKFSDVYDEVFGKLNKYNQEFDDELALYTSVKVFKVYQDPKSILIQGDTAKYPKPYVIPVDTLGLYMISMRVRMTSADKSIDPHITAYFYKNVKDENPKDRLQFVDFPIQKVNFMRDYQFKYKLEDKNYKYLKIFVPRIKNTDSTFMKEMQISELKVLNLKKPLNQEKKD